MIHGIATPLLVPLIEENWISEEVTKEVLRKYLEPLMKKGIDTLMLACTHYPLLIPLLTEILPDDVRLVDSATTCAEHLKRMLEEKNLLSGKSGEGKLEIHLTDLSEQFEELAGRFLNRPTGRVRRAVLGSLDFPYVS
jgi:glutamate racemase